MSMNFSLSSLLSLAYMLHFLVLFRLSSLFNVLFISCVLFIIKVYLKYSFFVCVTYTTKHAVLQNL